MWDRPEPMLKPFQIHLACEPFDSQALQFLPQLPFAEAVRVFINVPIGSESSRWGVVDPRDWGWWWCPLGSVIVSLCSLFVLGLPVGSQSPFRCEGLLCFV